MEEKWMEEGREFSSGRGRRRVCGVVVNDENESAANNSGGFIRVAEGRKDRTRPLPVYDSLLPILLPSFINQRPRAQSFNPSIQVGKRALLLLSFNFLCLPFSFLFSPKSTPSPSSSPFYPHSSEQRSLGASDVGGRPQKGKAKERVWPNG